MSHEIEHSRIVNELMELKEKLKNSIIVDNKLAKWNFNKCVANGKTSQASVWNQFVVASCEHEYEDKLEADGTFIGCICVHCGANSDKDEAYEASKIFTKSCWTCKHKGGADNEIMCVNPKLDDLDDIEKTEWMNKFFDSDNCLHWIGKV